ncbi:MAG TPA: CDP-diacylglycerol--glycerol-3-phosphate 3-phosphatidyltransferase [Terriglobales bacterium]|nr:CDP-diacylglycerol--glycerol-3-phosphate 3-phosphatidyltransferase [Terriglobales bacterium]
MLLRQLPNLITVFRIALIPVLVWFLYDPGRGAAIAAALTFHLACWSDLLDGYLARRWDISTTFGKLLDPVADKMIVAAALIMLLTIHREPAVPGWIVVVIIGRELAVTGLRAVALSHGVIVAADELGKYKTGFQMLAVQGLLLHYDFLGIDFHVAGMYFLWISLVIGIWSGIDYFIRVIHILREHPGALRVPPP